MALVLRLLLLAAHPEVRLAVLLIPAVSILGDLVPVVLILVGIEMFVTRLTKPQMLIATRTGFEMLAINLVASLEGWVVFSTIIRIEPNSGVVDVSVDCC